MESLPSVSGVRPALAARTQPAVLQRDRGGRRLHRRRQRCGGTGPRRRAQSGPHRIRGLQSHGHVGTCVGHRRAASCMARGARAQGRRDRRAGRHGAQLLHRSRRIVLHRTVDQAGPGGCGTVDESAHLDAVGEGDRAGDQRRGAGGRLRSVRRRAGAARVLQRTPPLGRAPPWARAQRAGRTRARSRPAPGRAAGAGGTPFPVQYAGLGARAGAAGSRTGRSHAGCAGRFPARHHSETARRPRPARHARPAARYLQQLPRTDAGAHGRPAGVRRARRRCGARVAVPALAADHAGGERDQARHRTQAGSGPHRHRGGPRGRHAARAGARRWRRPTPRPEYRRGPGERARTTVGALRHACRVRLDAGRRRSRCLRGDPRAARSSA